MSKAKHSQSEIPQRQLSNDCLIRYNWYARVAAQNRVSTARHRQQFTLTLISLFIYFEWADIAITTQILKEMVFLEEDPFRHLKERYPCREAQILQLSQLLSVRATFVDINQATALTFSATYTFTSSACGTWP